MAKNPQEGGGYESRVCPVCSKDSSKPCNTLILRQINDSEAIYVCSNPDCYYPVGQEVTVVERTIKEMVPGFENPSSPQETSKLTCLILCYFMAFCFAPQIPHLHFNASQGLKIKHLPITGLTMMIFWILT